MTDNANRTDSSRRNFLRLAAGATVATAAIATSGPAAALTASDPLRGLIQRRIPAAIAPKTPVPVKTEERVLSFYNTHTHEELKIVYWANGNYVKPSLAKLDLLMRDHRENEACVMDHKLYDQLWELQQRLGSEEVFEIISGYRSPATNNMLRKRSNGGVASRSYHLKGRAIDVRLRGSKTSDVRKVAVDMKAGGVGYYPGSDFVHLDTGPIRNWS